MVLLAVALSSAASAHQIVVPVNGAPPGPRTGLIVGQVVDAVTGAPIPEAIVTLTMPKYSYELPTTPRGRVMADGEGRYFFSDLPAGDYYIRATKEGYPGTVYGQRRILGPTQQLALAEGERRTDAKLFMWQYGTIAGTVVDEAGEPVIGIKVHALSRDFLAGHARFGKMATQSFNVPTATTDDRGQFRFSALAPADYAIAVPSTQTTVPVAVLNSFPQNSSLRGDLLMAVQPNGGFAAPVYEAFPLGQSRALQVGDFALLTMNGVAIPPPPTSTGRLEVYPTTYYPAAMTVGGAALITVKAGEERADVGVRIRPTSAVRVSGRLVTPSGAPPGPTIVRLIGASAADVGDDGFETVVGMSDAGGRFTLLGVPPGEYVLKTSDRFISLAARQGKSGLWAQQAVSVGSTDVNDLAIAMRAPLTVDGRIEFRSANGSAPAAGEFAARALMFERPSGDRGFAAEIANNAFSIAATAGQYIVRPVSGVTSDWVLDSVTIDGKNVADKVIDITTDTSLIVTYTDRRSPLSGIAKDSRGAASPGALALVFPTKPDQWLDYGANPRTLQMAQADRNGAYKFNHLPPGDYFVTAIDNADGDNWTDPKKLELLARQASKITVVTGESKTLDLTVRTIR